MDFEVSSHGYGEHPVLQQTDRQPERRYSNIYLKYICRYFRKTTKAKAIQ